MPTDSSTDSLSYLGEVIALFGDEEAKYSEFHQLVADFVNKKDGDEIIRRTKELFDGDERMVMGFYMLLLQQKSNKTKKKRKHIDSVGTSKLISQIVWLYSNNKHLCKSFLGTLFILLRDGDLPPDAYKEVAALFHDCPKVPEDFVDSLLEAPEATIPHFEQSHGLPTVKMFSISSRHVNKMRKDHNSHANDSDLEQNILQRHVETDRMEDSGMTGREKNEKYLGDNCRKMNSDNKIIMTEFLKTEGKMDKFVKTDLRDRIGEQNVNEKKKHISHKRVRDEGDESSDKELPSVPSDAQSRKHRSLSKNKKDTTPIALLDLSNRPSCTPSYRLLPKKLIKLCSQRTELGAPVLNDSWVSGYYGKGYSTKKPNQYEEMFFQLEDDMCELDMLVGSVRATVKKLKEIIMEMSDKCISSASKFHMKKVLMGKHSWKKNRMHSKVQMQKFLTGMHSWNKKNRTASKVQMKIFLTNLWKKNMAASKVHMKNFLTGSNLRCIRQFYDLSEQDILQAVRKSTFTLHGMLSDLEQWKKYLKICRANFQNVCHHVHAKHNPK